MKFVHPYYLGLLLLLLFCFGLLFWDENRRQKKFSIFAERQLWPWIAPEIRWKQRIWKSGFTLLASGFAILSLARPQFGFREEVVQTTGLDIMIVLDVSSSMGVGDVAPSRLLKAKHVIRSIVNRLGGDRVGLVAFALSSYVACPLTTNVDYFLESLQIMGPKTIQNQGTDIGSALDTASKSLERGAEDGDPNQLSRVVVLLSDGEDHEDEAIGIAKKMKESGLKVYILGIGTQGGGPIPLNDEEQSQGFKKDRSGQTIVSQFQPKFLSNLAEASGGKYWSVTPGEGEIQELLDDLGTMSRIEGTERRTLIFEDRFQIPLIISILLFLGGLSIPARKIALWIPFLIFIFNDPVFGAGVAPLDSYLDNQDGIKAYQEGRLEDAQREFGSAQARDPSRPELDFNQGVVQWKLGNSEKAIQSFQSAAQGAAEKKDFNLVGKSQFNLGNALSKKGDFQGAVRSYLDAIGSAIQAKNHRLEEEARKNLQLLTSEVKKQEQQKQKKESEKQEEDQKKKQDSSKESETPGSPPEKQDPRSQQTKLQSKKETEKQQFHSKKMDRQDAERVLSELTNRERELKERLSHSNARTQSTSKDW